MHTIESTPAFVAQAYARMRQSLSVVRRRLGRPLTLAEKVLYGHLEAPEHQDLTAGQSYLMLRPDRVAMQDATAQMALLQLALAGRERAAVPTTVHCDHLIQARAGARADTDFAILENNEVYEFLRAASARYGIGFWRPGSGIIHQVVLENYAFPGGLMIGTDSHTPNAGGLGMFAAGVGGADAVDVMAGSAWEVKNPTLIGVRLTGELSGWASPKDVILYLCGILTVQGGTNRVIEYFGPGARAISATGKATITNMGAELGATTSIFPYDDRMAAYLRGTGRAALTDLAGQNPDLLTADRDVEEGPEPFFERIVDIDLSRLEPHVVGPHTPDLARPVSKLAADVAANHYPDDISVALIGSCTNSSYEDISRAADVAAQARAHGARIRLPFLVTPGSEQIRQTIERDGQMADLEAIGAKVLANACGPCIGQWQRQDVGKCQPNTILTSFNRNFPKRNDGDAATMAFISSPEIVIAYGLAGRLSFNPLTDTLEGQDGQRFRLQPPKKAPELPPAGFAQTQDGYLPPPEDGSSVHLEIRPDSQRLQALDPFPAWDGQDFLELPILIKARGKCTTDHISPAGPWLRFRGHLDNISDNLFSGAINAYTGQAGTGAGEVAFAKIARDFKTQGRRWVAVGDENYGEGSSREHAAMSARFLGAAAILVRGFARIHESNLKKQGVLPLTFADPAVYDRVQETDRVSLVELKDLAPGRPVRAILRRADGSSEEFLLHHTFNREQIQWFQAGSALNMLRLQAEPGLAAR